MIAIFAALVAVSSPFAVFDRQQRNCERRFADNDFVEYAGCVVRAGEHEQREFKRLIAAAIHNRRITPSKFESWSSARDRRCKKEGRSIPSVNLQPVGLTVCIARSDDELLKSLQAKR